MQDGNAASLNRCNSFSHSETSTYEQRCWTKPKSSICGPPRSSRTRRRPPGAGISESKKGKKADAEVTLTGRAQGPEKRYRTAIASYFLEQGKPCKAIAALERIVRADADESGPRSWSTPILETGVRQGRDAPEHDPGAKQIRT